MQKCEIEEVIKNFSESKYHIILYYLKFDCKLNYIEYYKFHCKAYTKHYYEYFLEKL